MTQEQHQAKVAAVRTALNQVVTDIELLAASDYHPTTGDKTIPYDVEGMVRAAILKIDLENAPLEM